MVSSLTNSDAKDKVHRVYAHDEDYLSEKSIFETKGKACIL